eukprot:TRINITY_DN17320_c0_g1_i1.p1 TRINITY_DN17320_c0_g1~~TRINITY_DN17320_c0_g1_i1.p1  ORF type:complete len:80 (-),score=8.53 TRINITY_DN17320_c0_g1_i1:21-260(-)
MKREGLTEYEPHKVDDIWGRQSLLQEGESSNRRGRKRTDVPQHERDIPNSETSPQPLPHQYLALAVRKSGRQKYRGSSK